MSSYSENVESEEQTTTWVSVTSTTGQKEVVTTSPALVSLSTLTLDDVVTVFTTWCPLTETESGTASSAEVTGTEPGTTSTEPEDTTEMSITSWQTVTISTEVCDEDYICTDTTYVHSVPIYVSVTDTDEETDTTNKYSTEDLEHTATTPNTLTSSTILEEESSDALTQSTAADSESSEIIRSSTLTTADERGVTITTVESSSLSTHTTVVNGVVTVYTTWCPLTETSASESVSTTEDVSTGESTESSESPTSTEDLSLIHI